jgi:hypothetical protein
MKSWRKGAGIDVIVEEAERSEGLEERALKEIKSWRKGAE